MGKCGETKERRKKALTLVGLELVTPGQEGQEARVLTIRPPEPPVLPHPLEEM